MIARWGIPAVLTTLALTGAGAWLLPVGPARWAGAAVAALLTGAVAAFFRNPRRTPPGGPRDLVSPADGVVADVEEIDEPRFLGGRAVRIGVFMSVFDVHVNRSPVDGTVAFTDYRPGSFLDIRRVDAINANEARDLGIAVDPAVAPGLKVLVRQLAGLVARRIVCPVGVGAPVVRGGVFGMIKFGSRLELWLPVGTARVAVRPGERVRAGESVLAVLTSGAAP